MTWLESLYWAIYWQVRSIVKWVLRKTTRLCELERICFGCVEGFPRSDAVEYSLAHSKAPEIRVGTERLDGLAAGKSFSPEHAALFAEAVVKVKSVKPACTPPFLRAFQACVEHIWGYKQLMGVVEDLRLTHYDPMEPGHERKLLSLWDLLMPGAPLEGRITKQWQDIGFQGDDPKTDFRGMGLLGLDNLLYFASEFTEAARHVLSHSLHPQCGYCFAIVGINITSMAYNLLKDGAARTHLYNKYKTTQKGPQLDDFHKMYCYLFYEFDRFWVSSKPQNMMQFSFIREKFETNVRGALASPDCVLVRNFTVDTI